MKKIDEYKRQLLAAIIESKLENGLYVNFIKAQEEVDIIINSFLESAISENEEANEVYIDISVSSAISSYRMIPKSLPIDDRIKYINGINIGTQFVADMKDKNIEFEELSLNPPDLAKEIYDSLRNDLGLDNTKVARKEDCYTLLGICEVIEMMYKYDTNKPKENKKRNDKKHNN